MHTVHKHTHLEKTLSSVLHLLPRCCGDVSPTPHNLLTAPNELLPVVLQGIYVRLKM